jgi:predicted cobalt transporter CbtA
MNHSPRTLIALFAITCLTILTMTSMILNRPTSHHAHHSPIAYQPSHCPEDALALTIHPSRTYACLPADDFAPNTPLRRASDAILYFCPIHTAAIAIDADDAEITTHCATLP